MGDPFWGFSPDPLPGPISRYMESSLYSFVEAYSVVLDLPIKSLVEYLANSGLIS